MPRYKLVDGRPTQRFGHPGKTHIVNRNAEPSALDEYPTLCGRYPSGRQHVGTLAQVTCKMCLRSVDKT